MGSIVSILGCGGLLSFFFFCKGRIDSTAVPASVLSDAPVPNPTNLRPLIPPIEQKQKNLNVLVIYGDDWRHDSLGIADEDSIVQTPFFDELARDGIRFTQNCVTTSICWVSRASYFTGQYLSRHQSIRLNEPKFYKTWNESWPALLQQKGYMVGHVGKWQFSNPDRFVENAFNFTSLHAGSHAYGNLRAATRAKDDDVRFLDQLSNISKSNGQPDNGNGTQQYPLFALTVAMYPPKALGDSPKPEDQLQAMEQDMMLYLNDSVPYPFGRENNDSFNRLPKFFNNGSTLEARRLWERTLNTDEKYQETMKRYYALITEVDRASKDMVDELTKRGLYNDTLIIFTADNGYFHGEHGLAGKWFPYKESIRVPLIIRDPRMPNNLAGTTHDAFTLNIDLAPTILGAANLAPPAKMQGNDVASLYLKDASALLWREEFFHEHHSMGKTFIPATTALVRKQFKYFLWPEWNNSELLFDLVNDPFEQDDLSTSLLHRMVLNEMRTRHGELQEQSK